MDIETTTGHSDETSSRGMFIVFEGGEGSGKSTQARMLALAFTERNIPCKWTREPGDTGLGTHLRSILLERSKQDPISRKAEALLFLADRAEHVEKVVQPALERGENVICDRYSASTMAYQAYAGGLDPYDVNYMSKWASGHLSPDMTYLLDVDPVVGLERVHYSDRNRFEDEKIAYHENVRQGFQRQVNSSWMVVDAKQSIRDVHTFILRHALNDLRARGLY